MSKKLPGDAWSIERTDCPAVFTTLTTSGTMSLCAYVQLPGSTAAWPPLVTLVNLHSGTPDIQDGVVKIGSGDWS